MVGNSYTNNFMVSSQRNQISKGTEMRKGECGNRGSFINRSKTPYGGDAQNTIFTSGTLLLTLSEARLIAAGCTRSGRGGGQEGGGRWSSGSIRRGRSGCGRSASGRSGSITSGSSRITNAEKRKYEERGWMNGHVSVMRVVVIRKICRQKKQQNTVANITDQGLSCVPSVEVGGPGSVAVAVATGA